MKILLSEITRKEARDKISPKTVIVIPTGATEQHGDHLPLGFDYLAVNQIAIRAAETVSEKIPVIVTPVASVGCSDHHKAYQGTLSLNHYTFINYLFDVSISLIAHQFEKILFLNGHGGNTAALEIVLNRIKNETGIKLAVLANYWNLCKEEIERYRETDAGGMGHAGEFETSLALYLFPHLVQVDEMQKSYPNRRLLRETLDLVRPGEIFIPWRAEQISDHGFIGDPFMASTKKGKIFFESAVEATAKLIEEISAYSGETV